MKAKLFFLFTPPVSLILLLFAATVNGIGCDFKANRKINNNEGQIEEYVLCKAGVLNIVTTETEPNTRWKISGRFFSIGKQILVLISSRKHIGSNTSYNKGEVDREMYANDNFSMYHYVLLPIDDYRMALFQKKPTSDILLYHIDGDIDLWDSIVGYKKVNSE